ncbi:hypothetical protein Y1Q_0006084 [Alligator mississippiensis]|uniref:Uncharacterized protein n=1 Tax=Alligator mississippiensis TaxID=8496 RepID=A0A151N414_ALLMI|nr:hypothetical protein Y1Q_0006084 [Alligator mississippiensis]
MTFNVKCCERLKGDADTLGKLATGNGLELGYFIGCLHNGDWKAEKARAMRFPPEFKLSQCFLFLLHRSACFPPGRPRAPCAHLEVGDILDGSGLRI